MAATRTPRYADAAHEITTFGDANERYPREWVLFKVTEDNPDEDKRRGYVLAHTTSRKKLARVERSVLAAEPEAFVSTFYGGMLRLPPEEWMRRLEELGATKYVNAHW
jgi:hypothetical protein